MVEWVKLTRMKIDFKALPRSRMSYEVSVEPAKVTDAFKEALRELAKTVKVAGFRSGKAPENLVRAQIDEAKLREEAYSHLVSQVWRQLAKDLKQMPIEDPAVEVVKFAEGEEAKLKFEFDVRPPVKLGAWQKIKLSRRTSEAVSDKEIESTLNALARSHAKMIVKLTPAQKGDKVDLTFSGSLGGVRLDKLSSKHFPLILGEGQVLPGFEDKIIGLKKGDKKSFSLKFPQSHFEKSLVGKTVDFEVEVEEVYEVILPEINDDFAAKFDHKTLKALSGAIKKDLVSRRANEELTNQKAEWLAKFEKLVETELPESLTQAEIERSRSQFEQFLRSRNLDQQQWLKDRELTLEQLQQDWRKMAESSVRIGLGLAEAAKTVGKSLKTNEDFQSFVDELVSSAIEKK